MKAKKYLKLISVLLCLTMILVGTTIAFAADLDVPVTEDPIDEYQYCRDARADLHISSGTASFSASAKGYTGVATKITGTCYLQKYSGGSWVNVKSTTGSSNSLSLYISSSKTNCSSGTYRTHAVFTVYSGSGHETVTVNSSNVSC